MSKLYGPDEGYEVVRSRSSKKTSVNKIGKSQHVSLYSTFKGKISDLISTQLIWIVYHMNSSYIERVE